MRCNTDGTEPIAMSRFARFRATMATAQHQAHAHATLDV